jgi:hypothetical protein
VCRATLTEAKSLLGGTVGACGNFSGRWTISGEQASEYCGL